MKLRCFRRLSKQKSVRAEIISELDSMAEQYWLIAYLLQLIIGGWLAAGVVLGYLA